MLKPRILIGAAAPSPPVQLEEAIGDKASEAAEFLHSSSIW